MVASARFPGAVAHPAELPVGARRAQRRASMPAAWSLPACWRPTGCSTGSKRWRSGSKGQPAPTDTSEPADGEATLAATVHGRPAAGPARAGHAAAARARAGGQAADPAALIAFSRRRSRRRARAPAHPGRQRGVTREGQRLLAELDLAARARAQHLEAQRQAAHDLALPVAIPACCLGRELAQQRRDVVARARPPARAGSGRSGSVPRPGPTAPAPLSRSPPEKRSGCASTCAMTSSSSFSRFLWALDQRPRRRWLPACRLCRRA